MHQELYNCQPRAPNQCHFNMTNSIFCVFAILKEMSTVSSKIKSLAKLPLIKGLITSQFLQKKIQSLQVKKS